MEIKDLAGLSKPLTRLVEVVSKGVGAVSGPYLIRKTAEARAYEIKTIANALKDVRDQNQLPVVYDAGAIEVWQKPDDKTLILDKQPFDGRVARRLDYQERKRQENIENVTTAAAAELSKETVVAGAPPDDDWVARFFDYAQNISSQQMQDLWGRILAGEIKKPGSYSLRALDFVKNITKAEAQTLEVVGKLALRASGVSFVVVQDKEWLKKERGLHPGHHFLLGELGIMFPTDLAFCAFNDSHSAEEVFWGDDHLLIVKRGKMESQVDLTVWKFTGIGQELLSLVPKPLDEQYLQRIGDFFLSRKGEPFIARITERLADGSVRYEVIKEIGANKPKPEANPPASTT